MAKAKGAKAARVHDDPMQTAILALVTIQMRRTDAEGRKKTYDELYTMHRGALAQGQTKSAALLYAMTSWAGVQRGLLDPH